MKRTFLLFVTFMLALNSFAQGDFEYNGIWYQITSMEEGKVEVAGSWDNYNYSGDVVIPEIVSDGFRVTGVAENAFRWCRDLTSVTLPEGITYIGDGAFLFCDNLLSVNIPESVTTIGQGAFVQCVNIGSITIPASVNSIGLRAFVSCMLTSITVDEKNAVYDSRDNCNAIIETETGKLILGCQNTVIPSGIKSIGDDAFGGSGITGPIIIPEGVTSIGEYAFRVCRGITSISIPKSVKSIGEGSFSNCADIESIFIPEGIDSIRNFTFGMCSGLKTVDLPSSLTCIDESAFYGCESLAAINLPENISTIGKTTFVGCKNLSSIAIPDSVKSIGQGAFEGCSKLTSITIPKNVSAIEKYAFFGCDNLESVYSCSQIPPSISADGYYSFPFDNTVYSNATLYVPEGCVEAYSSAEGWSQFDNIKTFDPAGIMDILDNSGANVVPVSYYNLSGERFDYPQNGLNIIKYSNGQVRKVLLTE